MARRGFGGPRELRHMLGARGQMGGEGEFGFKKKEPEPKPPPTAAQ